MTSVSNSQRPASIAVPRSTPSLRQSIKNPFRRQQNPSSTISTASSPLPPPAYSTLASDKTSTAPSKKATSLFSWKSGNSKMSWIGFNSLRGKSDLAKQEAGKGKSGNPELGSSADRLKSTWKRRQNRHGVLEFEFQPPFIVELDNSLPPQTRAQIQLGSLAPSPQPPRSTFTPSPVPPVSPRSPRTREIQPPASRLPTTTITASSRLPRISETQPSKIPIPPPSSISAEPSPDLTKNTFSDKFPLPPARRPSSAELVASKLPQPTPTKSLLSPPRNISSPTPNRFTSSSLPRPKNGPFTASNPYPVKSTSTSRLPTPASTTRLTAPSPSPSTSTSSSSSSSSTTPTVIRKPISIPAKPRNSTSTITSTNSPRLTTINNNVISAVVAPNEGGRTSWDSVTTVSRSSSASEDTVIASTTAAPFTDLKKRTTITVGTIPTLQQAGKRESKEPVRLGKGLPISEEEERKGWEKEVEDMFSEERMKDLLIQLGI